MAAPTSARARAASAAAVGIGEGLGPRSAHLVLEDALRPHDLVCPAGERRGREGGVGDAVRAHLPAFAQEIGEVGGGEQRPGEDYRRGAATRRRSAFWTQYGRVPHSAGQRSERRTAVKRSNTKTARHSTTATAMPMTMAQAFLS